MTAIAPTMQSFFTDRLIKQRRVSPRTIAVYRDTMRLLVTFTRDRHGRPAHQLDWADLDTATITAFLEHCEQTRNNSTRTRNLRLTAIRSLFAYAALRHSEHAGTIQQVLAIPPKRFDKPTITFLTNDQIDALVAAPDMSRWEGRRDRAFLLTALQTGLRVSELVGLNCSDITTGTGAAVTCIGKGRRHRAVPLTTPTQAVLRVWTNERAGQANDPLFPTRTGNRLSSDAVQRLVRKHAITAATTCPTIRPDQIHPHTLRHSCAMTLLHAEVDTAVIALWLGHADLRSTNAYLHADMTIKQRALDRTTPTTSPPGRYKPTDTLLAFLEAL
jgi:site-specific recombinase XerD